MDLTSIKAKKGGRPKLPNRQGLYAKTAKHAFLAIILAGPSEGLKSFEGGFRDFARVGLLFTAVAIPAQMLQDSNFFDLIGARLGVFVGSLGLKFKIDIIFLISFLSIFTTHILAALFHNTTSILNRFFFHL